MSPSTDRISRSAPPSFSETWHSEHVLLAFVSPEPLDLGDEHVPSHDNGQSTLLGEDDNPSRPSVLLAYNDVENASSQPLHIEDYYNEQLNAGDDVKTSLFGFPLFFWRDLWIETSDPSLCVISRDYRLEHYGDDENFRLFRDGFCRNFMSISPQEISPHDSNGLRERNEPTDPTGINVILHLGLDMINVEWLFCAEKRAWALEIQRLNEWALQVPMHFDKIGFVSGTLVPVPLLQDAFFDQDQFQLLECMLEMGVTFDQKRKEYFRYCMENMMERWTEPCEVDKWITLSMRYKLQPFTPDYLMSLPLCPPEPKVTRNVAVMLQLLHRKRCVTGFELTPLRSLIRKKPSRLYSRDSVWPSASYCIKQKWAMDSLASSDCLVSLIERPDPV